MSAGFINAGPGKPFATRPGPRRSARASRYRYIDAVDDALERRIDTVPWLRKVNLLDVADHLARKRRESVCRDGQGGREDQTGLAKVPKEDFTLRSLVISHYR